MENIFIIKYQTIVKILPIKGNAIQNGISRKEIPLKIKIQLFEFFFEN